MPAKAPPPQTTTQEYFTKLLLPEKLPPLLPAPQVAQLLGLDRRRIYELVAQGELAALRLGPRRLRIVRDSLVSFVRAGGTGHRHERRDEALEVQEG